MARTNLLTSLVTLCILLNGVLAMDRTLEERAAGKDVVDAVVEKLRRLLKDDAQFLRRIAYVETKDGTLNTTFEGGNYGGIWNLNQFLYTRTKRPALANLHNKIQKALNITWADTKWEDLLKPLYSGLAARLYIESLGVTIPQKLEEQADFWFSEYNSRDGWTPQYFLNQTDEFENSKVPCDPKVDLVAIMDRSGSIKADNFQKCRQFLADFFGQFRIGPARLSLVTFDTNAQLQFPLDNYMTLGEISDIVLKLDYPAGSTNTNAALMAAAGAFKNSEPRPGVPKVATIFTDGGSKNPQGVDNIRFLQELNVSSYVIGIKTGDLNLTEIDILAYNISTNIYFLDDFDVLTEFFGRLSDETCKEPQKPMLNEAVEDFLIKGQRRYYALSVPSEGLTLEFTLNEGNVKGYWSRTERNPSSALYDGLLEVELGTYVAPVAVGDHDQTLEDDLLYVTVEGVEEFNNYTVEAVPGNFASTQPSTEPGDSTDPSDYYESTTPDGSASISSNLVGIVVVAMVTMFFQRFTN